MAQLQNAFPHLFTTVDHPDYIHLANSTALDDPVAPLDNAFLNNVLSDTNRLLLSTLRQLMTNRSRTDLIKTWYFLLSTSIMDENAGRCAATTVIATLSTN